MVVFQNVIDISIEWALSRKHDEPWGFLVALFADKPIGFASMGTHLTFFYLATFCVSNML